MTGSNGERFDTLRQVIYLVLSFPENVVQRISIEFVQRIRRYNISSRSFLRVA